MHLNVRPRSAPAHSRIPPQTDEQLREVIASTYSQLAFIDHQVGRLTNTLQELELDDNTIVIYVSDHSEWLLRVQMIVKGAGVAVDELVATLDLEGYLATRPRDTQPDRVPVRNG
ncbi:sulfatase-like hydrolase/transferase [Sulfitobacter sp.]|uniref:sulfatase-like hydrolase/transferase n=1 Tax=Sulfitobacter sp. TaxID=1903071 RepID=UPI00300330C8